MDKSSKDDKIIKPKPTLINKGETALVKFNILNSKTQPLAIESFHEFNRLGRFILKDSRDIIVAVGVVRSIETISKIRTKPTKIQPQAPAAAKPVRVVKENPEVVKLRQQTQAIWSQLAFDSKKWNK